MNQEGWAHSWMAAEKMWFTTVLVSCKNDFTISYLMYYCVSLNIRYKIASLAMTPFLGQEIIRFLEYPDLPLWGLSRASAREFGEAISVVHWFMEYTYNFAFSLLYVAVSASDITLVLDKTGIKLVSPCHRGTMWVWRCSSIPAPATLPRFNPILKPSGFDISCKSSMLFLTMAKCSFTSSSVKSCKFAMCR